MPSRSRSLKPAVGEEIPISVLGIEAREEMLWIASESVPLERFPPCIQNMLSCREQAGRHRTAAILAAFLGQMGWSENEARRLWIEAMEKRGVEERIFAEWFGKMHCPKCETLKRESKGYPDLGIADLGYCRPDERCREFDGPVEYASELRIEGDLVGGRHKHIKTLHLARVFDWSTGREGEIDLSAAESKDLEDLLAIQTDNDTLVYTRAKVRGRLRPKFALVEAEGPRRRVLSELMRPES